MTILKFLLGIYVAILGRELVVSLECQRKLKLEI